MVVANEIRITEEEITAAVEEHAKASLIVDKAEKVKAKARVTIEAYRMQNPDAFQPAAFPGDGGYTHGADLDEEPRTYILARGDYRTKVVLPQKKLPQRVEAADVEALYAAIMDEFDDDYDLFGHTFDLAAALERLKEIADTAPQWATVARRLAEIIARYTKPPEVLPLSPRITSKEAKSRSR